MAKTRVQTKEVHRSSVEDHSVWGQLLWTRPWHQAGEVASQKMHGLLKSRSNNLIGSEVILSFEPMISWKYVVENRMTNGERTGLLLRCSMSPWSQF